MKNLRFVAALCLLIILSVPARPAFSETAQRTQNGLFPDEIVSADELKKMLDRKEKLVLFDARDKRSFDALHIDGAVLPRTEEYYRREELFRTSLAPQAPDADEGLKTAMEKVPHDTPIVTYCNSNCHASATLALRLKQLGFTNVRSMEEGYQNWEKKGYPVAKK